ncbi:MAG: SWIM zinc finger domain-containing protein [Candidatus Sericytochromatia bacterium]
MSETDLPAYFSDSLLRRKAGMTLYDRGSEIFESGSVLKLALIDRTLFAQVAGSAPLPYRVELELGDDRLEASRCDCPYGGPWCKHIVAAGLAALNEPGLMIIVPALEPQLQRLDKAELIRLMLLLQQQQPELALSLQPWLDGPLQGKASNQLSVKAANPAVGKQASQQELKKIRERTRQRLGFSDRRGRARVVVYDAEQVLDGLPALIDEVSAWLERDRPQEALAMLEEITDAFVPSFEMTMEWDEEGENVDQLEEIGELWLQTLLRLAPAQRPEELLGRLQDWQSELDDYFGGDALEGAILALEADTSLLEAALRGEVDPEIWALEVSEDVHALVDAQLKMLQQRGDWQQALNLAHAAGVPEVCARAMIALGQAEDAYDLLLDHLRPNLDSAGLCQQLEAGGSATLALDLAASALERGLHNKALACWARDAAKRHSREDLLRQAAWTVALAEAEMSDYRLLKKVLGETWASLREGFVDALIASHSHFDADLVEILLAEGRDKEVMAYVRKHPYDWETCRIAAEGLLGRQPDFCVETACRQAEMIMEGGNSSAYHHAAEWLELARKAWRKQGGNAQWQQYLQAQIEKHRRKYTLRPRLEALLKG